MGLELSATDSVKKAETTERRTETLLVLVFMGFLDTASIKNIAIPKQFI